MAQRVKRLPTLRETQVQSRGWEDPLEEEMATHPLKCSCLENPMDGGAWYTTVHGVTKSRTRLSDFTFHFAYHYCWLCWLFFAFVWSFSSCSERGLLFLVVHRLLIAVASLAQALGCSGSRRCHTWALGLTSFSSCGSQALEHWFSSCGAQA